MTDSLVNNRGKKIAAGAAALSVLASGGYVLAGQNNEANAAGTEWDKVEAGPNNAGTAVHSSGYSISNLLPNDDVTSVVGWENPENSSTWGWCVEAGYRASGTSDTTGTIPVNNDDSRLAAYAMSMYGNKSTDAVTNAAVSLIVHQNLDKGAVGLNDRYDKTGDRSVDTRNAFKDAENDAPAAVQQKADQIRKEFENYKPQTETQAKVTLTPTAKRNVYTAHVDVPGNISTTVELTGGAVFADGSGTKKEVKADGDYEVVFLSANPYMSSSFSAKATPSQTSVKAPATRINTYQTDGETEGGFHFQTMAWAVPSTVNITGSTATQANTPSDVKNIGVGTTAVDKADGDKYISPNGGTLTDTINYSGLAPDYEHEFKAELINKETGKPVLDKDGKPITATKKFTPSSANGSTTIDLDVPGISAGNTFVVYETLSFEGKAIADHKDINDLGQTVYTPEAKTKAVDKADNDNYLLQSGGTIVDTVSYKGLKTGTEYEVKGTLMDKETGKEFLDNGKPVVGTAKFTPTTENGSVKVEFKVPPTAAGKTLVAFEEVSDAQVGIVAEHKDINDTEQTVFVPNIGTTATDKADGDKSVADRNGTVVDEVAYTNLTPGKKYTFEGKLLDKVASKDGENVFLKDDKGEDIIVKKDFTPTERNGKVNLEFKLPDSAAGKTLVAFEKVSDEVGVVAVHEDKNDEKQTVYVREIGTLALDKQDKDHYLAQKGGTIVDTIRYKNFVPGAEYTMKGVLVDRAATVEALKKDPKAEPVYILNERGDNVEAETTFTVPEDAKMDTEYTVPVEFKVPDSAIGKDVVVYEDAFDAKGNPVAEHKNPEDDDQTVHVADIATLAYDKADNNSHITPGGTLVDRVEYTNLVPGKEYRLEGTIFHKNEGKLTDIKASGKFTADKSGNGVANLEFKIPENQVGGRYVVFEELYDGNNVLTAEHKNPNDANQSFEVVPKNEVPKTPSENRTPPPATPEKPQTPPSAPASQPAPAQPAPQQRVSQQSVPQQPAPAPQQNAPARVKTGGEGVSEGMNAGLAGILAAAALSLTGAVVLRKKFSL